MLEKVGHPSSFGMPGAGRLIWIRRPGGKNRIRVRPQPDGYALERSMRYRFAKRNVQLNWQDRPVSRVSTDADCRVRRQQSQLLQCTGDKKKLIQTQIHIISCQTCGIFIMKKRLYAYTN